VLGCFGGVIVCDRTIIGVNDEEYDSFGLFLMIVSICWIGTDGSFSAADELDELAFTVK
jgi:hypothetical protein